MEASWHLQILIRTPAPNRVVARRSGLQPLFESPGIGQIVPGKQAEQNQVRVQSLAERLVDPQVLLGRGANQAKIDDPTAGQPIGQHRGPCVLVVDAEAERHRVPEHDDLGAFRPGRRIAEAMLVGGVGERELAIVPLEPALIVGRVDEAEIGVALRDRFLTDLAPMQPQSGFLRHQLREGPQGCLGHAQRQRDAGA